MDWKSKRFKPVFQGLIILLIGLAGGILFDSLGISAGFFMGCMLFSGFYRFVVKSEIALTGIYNQLGQIIFGMLIGTSFRQENLETMSDNSMKPCLVTLRMSEMQTGLRMVTLFW